MLKFSLLGVGRIGKMHAHNIFNNPNCKLEYVYDINKLTTEKISKELDCKIARSPEEAISCPNVDVVCITTPTETHIDYILQAAKSGKAIFCEKPIDLDIKKVEACKKELEKYNVPIHIGFNRRFDLSHSSLKNAKDNGEIGSLEMIIISDRDAETPSIEFLKKSGGFFRDKTVHDFDLARFLLGKNDPLVEIFAFGVNLHSQSVKEANDLDTAMFVMKSQSGVLCHINNSRRAVYGYDQRIEIFGSKGMIISDNQTSTSIKKFNKYATKAQNPIFNFFHERYDQAYIQQLHIFIDSIINNKPTHVNFEDGRISLIIANAAYESFQSGKKIKINY